MKIIVIYFILSSLSMAALFALTSCAPPKLTEVMPPEGVRCKAEITLPQDRTLTTVVTDVRIYECK